MNLHDLVIEQALTSGDAVAVHDDRNGATTYHALDTLARRYATGMRRRGVGPGDRVIVWSDKNVDAVAAMQAALRVGAAYVPIAATTPTARVAAMVDDAAPALIVTDADVGQFAEFRITAMAELLVGTDGDDAEPPFKSDPNDPAYILYTSGSTGTPKGVCLSHRNALAFVRWAIKSTGLTSGDRLSNHAPFAFDLSVFDLYGAFASGASVHLVPAELAYAPEQLTEFLHQHEITVWYSVPSALTLMMHGGGLLARPQPPALRTCVFAGEPFAVGDLRTLRTAWPAVRLHNWYGPTETNVCTAHEVTDDDLLDHRPPPIGTACAGNRVELINVDESGTGEIVVEGPTVMLGYWGAPANEGPYRTGDLAHREPDGALRFVGRRDRMVKVRGHRVELAEVEAAVRSLDSVVDAAVVPVGESHLTELHAFVVAGSGARPSLLEIKRRCAHRLPPYMIVDRLHILAALPRTANGKTDRRALAAYAQRGLRAPATP